MSKVLIIDYEKCIGCRMCGAVCPFGAMSFDDIGKRVISCVLLSHCTEAQIVPHYTK